MIPLVRNLWLSEARGRRKALRIVYSKRSDTPKVEIFEPERDREVASGTVARFRAACPKCHRTTSRERVQAQLREKRGGAGDAMLLAVVRENRGGRGKDYVPPSPEDIAAVAKAKTRADSIDFEMPPGPSPEPAPVGMRTVRIVGTLRPELWNRLGTRIIPKLRPGSELRLGVDFSVTVEGSQASQLKADLRQIDDELGLGDSLRIE